MAVTVRLARETDAAAILAPTRRCPQGADRATCFEPRDDAFARSRYREKCAVFVAEENGAIVASRCYAAEDTVLAGSVRRYGSNG